MRLNRVLLLAASFICLVFAMVFTISCSGDDGKNGAPGKDAKCSAANSASGDAITITCDDGTTGTLQGTGPAGATGATGPQGPEGPQGPAGPAGTIPAGTCVLGSVDPVTGDWSVTCGTQTLNISGDGSDITGELTGCKNSQPNLYNNALIVLSCGSVDIYTCGGQVFNPLQEYCTKRKTTTDAVFSVPKIEPSTCGLSRFDSRTQFCDGSTIRDLCNGAEYTSSADETCVNGQVTKPCGNSRYIKATQFCMNNTTVTNRCGTPSSGGLYDTGADGDDMIGDDYIKGVYNTSNSELCLNGKVVKKCGTGPATDDNVYEEKTHFCAVGDVIAPHCDDRNIYNPTQRFCSYVGNKSYSPNSDDCKKDANDNSCKKYISTALPFCGSSAKYNADQWIWEYCVGKTTGTTGSGQNVISYSVLRCADSQVPDFNTGVGGIFFETCRCIQGATAYTNNRNGCYCPNTAGGYKQETKAFDPNYVAGQSYTSLSDQLQTVEVGIGKELATGPALGYTNEIANGYPNVDKLGTSSVSAWNQNDYHFFGGICATLPKCEDGSPEECKTYEDCIAVTAGNVQGAAPRYVWDARVSTCLSNPDKCSSGFGGKRGAACFTSEQPCGFNNLSACLDRLSCNSYGGIWDMWVLKNQCVEKVADCVSGAETSTGSGECAATGTCTADRPLSPGGSIFGCISKSACTVLGGQLSSVVCSCSNSNPVWDPFSDTRKCVAAASCPSVNGVRSFDVGSAGAAVAPLTVRHCQLCPTISASGVASTGWTVASYGSSATTTFAGPTRSQCTQCGGISETSSVAAWKCYTNDASGKSACKTSNSNVDCN